MVVVVSVVVAMLLLMMTNDRRLVVEVAAAAEAIYTRPAARAGKFESFRKIVNSLTACALPMVGSNNIYKLFIHVGTT